MEYTLILKNKSKYKNRGKTTATSFQLTMFDNKIVDIPLVDGIDIMFNAYLLTHRQIIMSRGEFPMINIGLHSNQKFGNHLRTSLERFKSDETIGRLFSVSAYGNRLGHLLIILKR